MLPKNLWSEFFADQNVRFPAMPKLLEGISIYDAPYGLGIQFRGGPKKLIIKGKTSSELFKQLEPLLNGERSLETIFSTLDGNFDINDIATVLKLLHAHNLLVDHSADHSKLQVLTSNAQLDYFKRVVGRTGYNSQGQQIAESLTHSKVLLIGSENLIPAFLSNLTMASIQNVGLFYYQTENILTDYQSYFPIPLMTETDISKMSEKDVLNTLHLKSDDYQYIIIGLENASRSLMTSVNDFAIQRNIPIIFFNSYDNIFEIGPYVIPKASSCYVCTVLRKNSYNQDAVFENIYHDSLNNTGQLLDKDIKGIDPVAVNVATGLLISDLCKVISGYSLPTLINHVTEFDSLNGKIQTYPVMRVPGCVSCSN